MGLKGGAIAGIVIGCVVFVVAKTACKLATSLIAVSRYRSFRKFCLMPSSSGQAAGATSAAR